MGCHVAKAICVYICIPSAQITTRLFQAGACHMISRLVINTMDIRQQGNISGHDRGPRTPCFQISANNLLTSLPRRDWPARSRLECRASQVAKEVDDKSWACLEGFALVYHHVRSRPYDHIQQLPKKQTLLAQLTAKQRDLVADLCRLQAVGCKQTACRLPRKKASSRWISKLGRLEVKQASGATRALLLEVRLAIALQDT